MGGYPFATLTPPDLTALRQERLHALEVSLARVLLRMEEGAGDPTLGEQHDDLVARLTVHRAALGLPAAPAPGEAPDADSVSRHPGQPA
jgi:hypothetical protein